MVPRNVSSKRASPQYLPSQQQLKERISLSRIGWQCSVSSISIQALSKKMLWNTLQQKLKELSFLISQPFPKSLRWEQNPRNASIQIQMHSHPSDHKLWHFSMLKRQQRLLCCGFKAWKRKVRLYLYPCFRQYARCLKTDLGFWMMSMCQKMDWLHLFAKCTVCPNSAL